MRQKTVSEGNDDDWHTYTRRAVDLVRFPDKDPLLASRAYSALGFCAFFNRDSIGAEEAIRRAVECAGDSPTKELAWALAARVRLRGRTGQFAAALEVAERAIVAGGAPESIEALMWSLGAKATALGYLGHLRGACETGEQLVDVCRNAGMVGHARGFTEWLAGQFVEAGQVAWGTRSRVPDTTRHWLPAFRSTRRAGVIISCRHSHRRGGSTPRNTSWTSFLDLAPPSDTISRGQAELWLARGDAPAAARVIPERAALDDGASYLHIDEYDVLRELRLADLRDDGTRCLELAVTYLPQEEEGDSPLMAAAATRIGFQALRPGETSRVRRERSPGWPESLLAAQLDRARARSDRRVARRVSRRPALALAEGFASEGRGSSPTIEEFRVDSRAVGAVRCLLRARAADRPGAGAVGQRRAGRGQGAAGGLLDSGARDGCARSGAAGVPQLSDAFSRTAPGVRDE